MSLLGEIKRRKVFKVAAVYAIVAWLVVQVVGAVAEPLNLPEWFDTVVIVLLAVGFPIAVVLGWAFDVTPDGIRSSSGAPVVDTKAHGIGNWFGYVSQALVLVAVAFLLADQYLLSGPPEMPASAVESGSARPVNRFDFRLPEGQSLSGLTTGPIALSPDGRRFVYNTSDGLYLRSMDALESRLLPGTVGIGPSFSPDGQSVVYWSDRGHRRVSIRGGLPTPLNDEGRGDPPPVPRWGSDGDVLYFRKGTGIFRQPGSGGSPELLTGIESGYEAYGPMLLPDGDSLLFSLAREGSDTWNDAQVVVQSLATGARHVLVENGRDARYVATGHILYGRDDTIYGIAFDPDTLTVSGGPVPLAQGVATAGVGIESPSANFDIAGDGTLIYLSGPGASRATVIPTWVDREGNEEPLGLEPRIFAYPRLSPDGSRIAFAIREEQSDIWVGDLARLTLTQLSQDAQSASPVWSADGGRLIFGKDQLIASQRADGSAPAEVLIEQEQGRAYYPRSLAPDGRVLLVSGISPPRDIGMLRLDGASLVEPLIATAAEEVSAELSPDGRWLAYDSDESGRSEVYVRPFPNTGDSRVQISVEGGSSPLFSRAGDELFYWADPGTIMSVPIQADSNGGFSAGLPRTVVQGDYVDQFAARQYDVSADGSRFVVLKRAETGETGPIRIVIVQNWLAELEDLVPRN